VDRVGHHAAGPSRLRQFNGAVDRGDDGGGVRGLRAARYGRARHRDRQDGECRGKGGSGLFGIGDGPGA
jgi:hypothetical protein